MAIVSLSSTAASTSLEPGFRFHPTDEELVFYYLRRKICGKSFRVDAISQIDIYKVEPWDLPGKSKLKTRDKEWYFFTMLDKKYGRSQRTNRATEKGYWKTTGKDRAVYHRSNLVGMKKTLVYHCGRAPRGERSNWVMHEYKLMDDGLAKAGFNQDSFVLCRVFQKSGSGPKNGEHYGASLIEEEWEKEEFELSPKMENEVVLEAGVDAHLDGLDSDLKPKMEYEDDDAENYLDGLDLEPKMKYEDEVDADAEDYLYALDLEQILGTDIVPIVANSPLDLHPQNENSSEDSTGSTHNTFNNELLELQDNHMLYEMPHQYGMDARLVKHEYLGESSKEPEELDYLLDEPLWNASGNDQYYDGSFLETKDLFNPISANTFDFSDEIEDFLVFPDANDANNDGFYHVNSENLTVVDGITSPSCETPGSAEDMNVETRRGIPSNDQLIRHEGASSSTQKEHEKFASVCQYPFLEKASQMLGSIPAPPAFAAEFPSKNAMKHLRLSQSSNSVHVTAGIIHIRTLPMGTSRTSRSQSKDSDYNIILSLGLSHNHFNPSNLESAVSILPGKFVTASRFDWFYAIFCYLLRLLSLSFKMVTLVCAR